MRRCLLLLPVVLGLAACGGGGGGQSEGDDGDGSAAYVDALAAGIGSSQNGFSMPEQDARCFAEAVVSALDPVALERAGISPATLAATDAFGALPMPVPDLFAADVHDAVLRCGLATSLESVYVDGLSSEPGLALSVEATGCITGAVDDNALALNITATMMDANATDEGIVGVFTNSLAACPGAVAELLLGGMTAAGATLSPEATSCVHAYVAADPVTAASIMASGTGGDEYGLQLAQSCPQIGG